MLYCNVLCVVCIVYDMCYYMFSVCLRSIQVDTAARLQFHAKHMKNSQALKNVAEHVIKTVRLVSAGGEMPTWYLPRDM